MRLRMISLMVGFLGMVHCCFAQVSPAALWADSVFNSLTDEQRITQLMIMRSSGMDAAGKAVMYDGKIDSLVQQYNIGAICAFQGTPLQHAAMFNRIQAVAQTPVMVTVDGEWGVGMRFAGVQNFPYQLTLGALSDAAPVYQVGKAIAAQCRRMNIHVNYAPVVDINNNPDNPVIGIRSFGEDKYKVALMGTRMMEGLQDGGVMACAKHFPGHGDVSVDSHKDLPVINKSFSQLDSLELYPFKQLFSKGIGSVMVAHLYIPAIDTTANQATSLSYKNITELMRNRLGFNGLTFTDALEMKGVTKFYPDGEAAVQSLIAGNDMLCLPADVQITIDAVKNAIAQGRLGWPQVYEKCKRVLLEKYKYVVGKTSPIDTTNLVNDLNKEVATLSKEVAEKALTVLALEPGMIPLKATMAKPQPATKKGSGKTKKAAASQTILYLAVGSDGKNELANQLVKSSNAKVTALPYNDSAAWADFALTDLKRYKKIVIGLHGVARYPARNFGIPQKAIELINSVQVNYSNAVLLTFGNPYVNKNFTGSRNLVACYEDDAVFQGVAADWLLGKFDATGTLPVTVASYPYGAGIVKKKSIATALPETVGMKSEVLSGIDSIAQEAINAKATPGCVVIVLKDGKMVFQKSYGAFTYDSSLLVTPETIYDLASVTKIAATTVSIMKLFEEGKIDLKKPIGFYLPWLAGSDKQKLTVENLMLHQAGFNPFIPFYKEVIDQQGHPLPAVFSPFKHEPFTSTVTNMLYLRNDWKDTMYSRIKSSTLVEKELKYVYSDNDFILMGKLVEAVSGQPLETYTASNFYEPLGMTTTGFRPYNHFANDRIAPTEKEKQFRGELLWGYVHDPGAAMFDNVAGHAGLFSNAGDLAKIFQMLLNHGSYDKKQYLKKQTIDWFTSYQTPISRRGLGFDKPEKDNSTRPEEKAYPSKSVSPKAYGHTGYTGTCVWVDPQYNLIYIFLSNRVNPDGGENNKLSQMNIRSRIQEVIYKAME